MVAHIEIAVCFLEPRLGVLIGINVILGCFRHEQTSRNTDASQKARYPSTASTKKPQIAAWTVQIIRIGNLHPQNRRFSEGAYMLRLEKSLSQPRSVRGWLPQPMRIAMRAKDACHLVVLHLPLLMGLGDAVAFLPVLAGTASFERPG